jgi:ribonuclease HI
MLFETDWIVNVDGASRGNPGEASYGFAITDKRGKIVYKESGYIGRATNNVAEYTAVVKALEFALRKKIETIEVRSDSQLLVRQLKGEYKLKSENLRALHERCRELLRRFKWYEIQHIPREQNKIADKLANEALDQQSKIVRSLDS